MILYKVKVDSPIAQWVEKACILKFNVDEGYSLQKQFKTLAEYKGYVMRTGNYLLCLRILALVKRSIWDKAQAEKQLVINTQDHGTNSKGKKEKKKKVSMVGRG